MNTLRTFLQNWRIRRLVKRMTPPRTTFSPLFLSLVLHQGKHGSPCDTSFQPAMWGREDESEDQPLEPAAPRSA